MIKIVVNILFMGLIALVDSQPSNWWEPENPTVLERNSSTDSILLLGSHLDLKDRYDGATEKYCSSPDVLLYSPAKFPGYYKIPKSGKLVVKVTLSTKTDEDMELYIEKWENERWNLAGLMSSNYAAMEYETQATENEMYRFRVWRHKSTDDYIISWNLRKYGHFAQENI